MYAVNEIWNVLKSTPFNVYIAKSFYFKRRIITIGAKAVKPAIKSPTELFYAVCFIYVLKSQNGDRKQYKQFVSPRIAPKEVATQKGVIS